MHFMDYMTIRELYRTFADCFPNLDFSRGFLYISERSSEGSAMLRLVERGGGAQRHVLPLYESKQMDARCARARTRGQNPLVQYIRIRRHKATTQQSAKLFLQSSELGLPQPLTRRRVCPPVERGVGRVPIPTRGQTLWYSLYIRTL
jgi:hypothetical protein